MEVVALRDIHSREEILNSYLDSSVELSSTERRKVIQGEWHFSCNCPICAGKEVAASDERREKITEIKEQIKAAGTNPGRALKHVKTLLSLYDEEGMILPLPANYWFAAVASNALGSGTEAIGFARLARKYWTIMFGDDSDMVKEMLEFERDPTSHPSRRRSD